MADRAPPYNLDAEQALLGAILLNNDAYHRVYGTVNADSFYEEAHRLIFTAIGKVIDGGQAADPVTLKGRVPDKLADDFPTSEYLAHLVSETPSVLNALDYAKSIADLATKRALISIAEGIQHAAYDGENDATGSQLLEDAEQHLFSLAAKGGRRFGFSAFADAVEASVEMVAGAYQNDGGLSGLPTGLSDLDRMMGGLQKSDLIILAGRPGMGKSALASNISFNLASNGCHVGFLSLEMSAEQLATRILSEQTGIASSSLRRGNIHEADFSRYAETARALKDLPLYIDDAGGQTIASITSTARRLHRQKGLDLLVVDYLQLLSGSTYKGQQNRVQELTEITTRLKGLAKELNVPILSLSQLSRQVENREDKRPQLSDLRESGSIEQDADVVLFVYREEYYLKLREPRENTTEHLTWQTAMQEAHGKAEVIIGKQRHGPTGTVALHFDANLTRFSNLAREDYLPARVA